MARRRRQPQRRQPQQQRRARPRRRNRMRRGASAGDVIGRAFRRTILAPWLPETAKKSSGNWLTTLKSAAGGVVPVLMKSVVRSFTSRPSKNTATGLPTAAISAFKIDSAFILATSPFVFSTTGSTSGYCRWQQVKLNHLHIRLTPSEKVSSRGGTLALAFVPCSISELSGSVLDYKQYTFDEVLAIPGAITAPASRQLNYNYVPKIGDLAYDWQVISTGASSGYGVCVAAFSDLSSDTAANVVDNYMPDTLGVELSTHANVSLRAPLAQINYREVKLDISYNNNPKSLFIEDHGIEIPAIDLILNDGFVSPKDGRKSFGDRPLAVSDDKQDKSVLSPASSLSTQVNQLQLTNSDANMDDDRVDEDSFVKIGLEVTKEVLLP